MNTEVWQSLAIQAPIVLIFAGAIYIIVKELIRYIEKLTDKFMDFIENRDKETNESLKEIAQCLSSHDQFTRAQFKEWNK